MRYLVLLLLGFTLGFGDVIIRDFSDERELEIKILEKIFTDITKKKRVRVVILGNKSEYFSEGIRKYSKRLRESRSCKKADIVFLAGVYRGKLPKGCGGKILFSSRKKDILLRENCVGAFYWKKGRPNILFIRERLRKKKIKLPPEYNRFIESLGSRSPRPGGKGA